MLGASSVRRRTRVMYDGAIPSRSASSAIVAYSPDSSIRFQRKARASALTRAGEKKAAAIAYTLIETAKLNAVNPHAWLADTLARVPDYKITRVDDVLPWRWKG
jgi:hypothetical protein